MARSVFYSVRQFSVLLATFILSVATLGSIAWADAPPTLLAEQTVKGFDRAQILPAANFQQYKNVLIQPTDVQFDEQWLRNHSHDISIKDQSKISEEYGDIFQKSLTKQLTANHKFNLVSSVTEETLVIKPRLQKLFINAPELSTSRTSDFYVNSVGRANVILELMDGKSGELLAVFEDAGQTRDRTGETMQKTDRLRNALDFRNLMDSWGKYLNNYLSPNK